MVHEGVGLHARCNEACIRIVNMLYYILFRAASDTLTFLSFWRVCVVGLAVRISMLCIRIGGDLKFKSLFLEPLWWRHRGKRTCIKVFASWHAFSNALNCLCRVLIDEVFDRCCQKVVSVDTLVLSKKVLDCLFKFLYTDSVAASLRGEGGGEEGLLDLLYQKCSIKSDLQ